MCNWQMLLYFKTVLAINGSYCKTSNFLELFHEQWDLHGLRSYLPSAEPQLLILYAFAAVLTSVFCSLGETGGKQTG